MGECDGIARYSHQDAQIFLGSVLNPDPLRSLCALGAPMLYACRARNRIPRRIQRCDDNFCHRFTTIHAGIRVALLELEGDVHEAHLRFAFDRLGTR